MARMYKLKTQHVKDSSNSSGGWNKVAVLSKDTPTNSGKGYVDRITVNFLVDDIDGADTLRSSFPFGNMFVLSNSGSTATVDSESNQLAPGSILDCAARDGAAGSVTLYARRSIAENADDTSEGDGYIYLWQKNTDLTVDDNVIMRYFIETYGRWVQCDDA